MHLIVGLGNPGPEYAAHRHNVGFLALDAIAREFSFPPFRQKFSALVSEASIGGEKTMLIKPQTFMNRSGDSVAQAVQFFKLEPADVSVIHDELDLAPGKARIKTGGGNGGHNGLKSLDAHLGPNYRRVRIGIGHPGHKALVNGHVLSNFHKADGEWLDPLIEALGRNADLLVKGDTAGLMNKIALAVPAPSASEQAPKAGQKATPSPRAATGQSHIRQARQQAAPKMPESGPMASMLRKLFGDRG